MTASPRLLRDAKTAAHQLKFMKRRLSASTLYAPARCPFFATFFGHAKKVEEKISS